MNTAAGRTRGFTLIELLVVLMIMGLIVGLVSAIVRPDDRGQLRVEAERLAQLLDLAAATTRRRTTTTKAGEKTTTPKDLSTTE